MADQFDRINQLEKRAYSAEESASEVRWQIADEIVRLLETGLTQAGVAAGWISLATGVAYGSSTVSRYALMAKKFPAGKRPVWAEAWKTVSGESGGRLPSNEEGVAMVLEKAAKVLQEKYEWTETEVKQEIAAAKVKPEPVAPEPKKVRVDHNYDLFVDALELVRQAEPPISKRAQTKLQELGLEVDILREEEATV